MVTLVIRLLDANLSWCHSVELTPSLLQKVNSVLYMCSYWYKELKASGILRIWDVNAMYVAQVD